MTTTHLYRQQGRLPGVLAGLADGQEVASQAASTCAGEEDVGDALSSVAGKDSQGEAFDVGVLWTGADGIRRTYQTVVSPRLVEQR